MLVVPTNISLVERGGSQPGEGLHLLLPDIVDHEGDFRSDAEHSVVHYAGYQHGSHRCIYCVAPLLQHFNPGSHRLRILGDYRTPFSRGVPTRSLRSGQGRRCQQREHQQEPQEPVGSGQDRLHVRNYTPRDGSAPGFLIRREGGCRKALLVVEVNRRRV